MAEASTELELIQKLIAARVVHDPDFNIFRHAKFAEPPVVLDIGANRGQSIVSFNVTLDHPIIHAFEVNPALHPVLDCVAKQFPSTTIHKYGLAEQNGDVVFGVPVVNGELLSEGGKVASISADMPWVLERFRESDPDFHYEKHIGQVRRGDRLGLPPCDIVKLDVEGAEMAVLRGIIALIAATKPVLLLGNSDWSHVTDYLKIYSYAPFRIEPENDRIVPFHGPAVNTLYIARGFERGLTPVEW
ncbi:hypothetical protein CCR94_11175 [Rhodoblastus sphagnicola]|uniref:Methyltransferase FkbM domain-containing protein n=1 Tax=Rhodoblastus sphagnicola TaxID=333368 RepID=A0A2S6N8I5_9HYPH|nr:FkbM family methyltransferase [Rhodoblastus sphagnicola]MBB4198128.1 FkbM family methyltransferase [Rhodoblastus sphagnicola]PPQ30907.1 hypothetical protein CCR94_11175 [Rhodoblastus sphagnicola]